MESIDPVWLFGGIALFAGALLGALLCRRFTPTIMEVDELRVKLERSRLEMENYRDSVNEHFGKTSDLVKELTEDYVKVYRHLSEGAQTLSDAPEFSHRLEQQKGRVLISMDDEVDSPDIEDVREDAPEDVREDAPEDVREDAQEEEQAEEISVQGGQAEAGTSAKTREVSGSGDSAVEDADREDPHTAAEVFAPVRATDDDSKKAAARSDSEANKRNPVDRTDTQ